jgi:hypothetical protein
MIESFSQWILFARPSTRSLLSDQRFVFVPAQCRAARGFLDWTQHRLADASRIGVATIRLFAETRHATFAVLKRAFELAGIEFIDANGGGPGVCLRKRPPAKPSKRSMAPEKIDRHRAMVSIVSYLISGKPIRSIYRAGPHK